VVPTVLVDCRVSCEILVSLMLVDYDLILNCCVLLAESDADDWSALL